MNNSRTMNRALLPAAIFAIAVALVAVLPGSASSDRTQTRGGALFGKAWVAKAVVKDGERAELVRGARLVLRLRHHRKEDRARWDAGCNQFGARVKVKPKRLRFGASMQTMIGCERKLLRQDNWIARFLAADPRWKRKAGKLVLRLGDDAIRLQRRR